MVLTKRRLKVTKIIRNYPIPDFKPDFGDLSHQLYLELLENKDKVDPQQKNKEYVLPTSNKVKTGSREDKKEKPKEREVDKPIGSIATKSNESKEPKEDIKPPKSNKDEKERIEEKLTNKTQTKLKEKGEPEKVDLRAMKDRIKPPLPKNISKGVLKIPSKSEASKPTTSSKETKKKDLKELLKIKDEPPSSKTSSTSSKSKSSKETEKITRGNSRDKGDKREHSSSSSHTSKKSPKKNKNDRSNLTKLKDILSLKNLKRSASQRSASGNFVSKEGFKEEGKGERQEEVSNDPPKLSEINTDTVRKGKNGNIKELSSLPNKVEETEANKRKELIFKFDILKRKYKNAKQHNFTDLTPLVEMEKAYELDIRSLNLDSTVENYKKYLIGGFMVVEFVLNMLKFDINGFAQQQLLTINSYEKLLIELGEKSYVKGGKSWPVEIRLLFMIVINAAIFIISKKMMGISGNDMVGMMNKVNGEAAAPVKKKMKGPDMSNFDKSD